MTSTWAEFERYEENVRSEGRKEALPGLREALQDLCEAYQIELTDSRRAALMEMDISALDALRRHLKLYRAWPDTPPARP